MLTLCRRSIKPGPGAGGGHQEDPAGQPKTPIEKQGCCKINCTGIRTEILFHGFVTSTKYGRNIALLR